MKKKLNKNYKMVFIIEILKIKQEDESSKHEYEYDELWKYYVDINPFLE